jgi:hypothetical protein
MSPPTARPASASCKCRKSGQPALIDADGRAVLLRDQNAAATQLPDWPQATCAWQSSTAWAATATDAKPPKPSPPACCASPPAPRWTNWRAPRPAAPQLQAHFSRPDDHDTFRRPGTTLTLLEIPPGQPPMLYHAGDSRLYEITAQARGR